jgi:di/tricarboxylate transporter
MPERKPLPRAHRAHTVGILSPTPTLNVTTGGRRRAQAWDTLFWFAVLVGMSGQLNALGVIKHFADAVGGRLVAMHLGWPSVFALLNAVYFGLHYMFASQTAHVGALYAAFLAMMLAAGAAPACRPGGRSS